MMRLAIDSLMLANDRTTIGRFATAPVEPRRPPRRQPDGASVPLANCVEVAQ